MQRHVGPGPGHGSGPSALWVCAIDYVPAVPALEAPSEPLIPELPFGPPPDGRFGGTIEAGSTSVAAGTALACEPGSVPRPRPADQPSWIAAPAPPWPPSLRLRLRLARVVHGVHRHPVAALPADICRLGLARSCPGRRSGWCRMAVDRSGGIAGSGGAHGCEQRSRHAAGGACTALQAAVLGDS